MKNRWRSGRFLYNAIDNFTHFAHDWMVQSFQFRLRTRPAINIDLTVLINSSVDFGMMIHTGTNSCSKGKIYRTTSSSECFPFRIPFMWTLGFSVSLNRIGASAVVTVTMISDWATQSSTVSWIDILRLLFRNDDLLSSSSSAKATALAFVLFHRCMADMLNVLHIPMAWIRPFGKANRGFFVALGNTRTDRILTYLNTTT